MTVKPIAVGAAGAESGNCCCVRHEVKEDGKVWAVYTELNQPNPQPELEARVAELERKVRLMQNTFENHTHNTEKPTV